MPKNQKLLTEIMAKNSGNQQISVVKTEDRTGDGNLLPETRERVLKSIKEHLKRVGYLNISELASIFDLSRQTTRKLVDEVIKNWSEEAEDQIQVQIKWYESTLKDITENPNLFDKDTIALVKLKSMLLGKINALRKLSLKKNG